MLLPQENIASHPLSSTAQDSGIRVVQLNPKGKERHTRSEPHRHDYYEIIFLEKGSGVHVVDFEQLEIHDNVCYLLAPESVHHFDTLREVNMQGWLVEISKDYMHTIDSSLNVLFCKNRGKMALTIPPEEKVRLSHLLSQMKEEQDSMRNMSAQAVASYFKLVMVELYRLLEQQQQAEHFTEPDERFLAFMGWVEVLHREVRSITVYADKVHLSPRQLNRICLDMTGKTANQLLNERVSLEAKRLLFNGQIQAKEVGYQLGFDDPSNFVKFFKRHNGISPAGFRETMSKINHR